MRYDFPIIFPIAVERIADALSKYFGYIRAKWYSLLWGIKVGRHCRFQGKTIVRTRRRGEIIIGNDVVLNSRSESNLVGIVNPTIMDTRGGGQIVMGDESGATSVVIHSKTSVRIGASVKIGGNVRIFDHDFHSLKPEYRRTNKDRDHIRSAPVIIEDDCFIGTNAIILKGTHLGKRTIVAAGSVVFGLHAPADSLVKGNPAVVIERYGYVQS